MSKAGRQLIQPYTIGLMTAPKRSCCSTVALISIRAPYKGVRLFRLVSDNLTLCSFVIRRLQSLNIAHLGLVIEMFRTKQIAMVAIFVYLRLVMGRCNDC